MKSSILTAAKVLWDYHCIYDPLEGADIIIGLGSYDPRVAERASDLYLEGLAPWLIFTGRSGRGTDKLYKASEAEAFAEIAIRRGVPERAIIIEPNATNIGENIRFSREKLAWDAVSGIFRHQAPDAAPCPCHRASAMAGSQSQHQRTACLF
ncbi:conserved hypothetical protein [Brucella ceti M644/93/1]|uniref:DUF218 domain-containing protein n=1 Tax=Brucella ceti M644/93/1 TaxID=520459 RepID=A0ABM9ZCU9_9HYPH|nr:conserved hypothetical protein [Brucella ceti M13/05/1]EEX97405.1 conserved hypothetical protein [Brucella ceti M644/93/1]ENR09436.1 hypothetical protein C068_01893 [Brucella sp. UK38/05]ENT11841.1 hypothetical protein C001_00241 [Brucella sp. F5/06]